MAFQLNVFEKAFNASIKKLAKSEGVTKEELKIQSRAVLEAVHSTGNIGYVNQLIAILSPVNKRVARLFFKEFSGFQYDEQTLMFTKKSAKKYEAAHKRAITFLEDPNNNIWSWSERNVEVEKKAFSLDDVTKAFGQWVKKAENEGLTQRDVLQAIMKDGVDTYTVIAILQAMGNVDLKVVEEQE